MNNKRKTGQEEMVGFVLIMIIVAVIAVVFLSISLRRPVKASVTESYEIYTFIQSLRQYTSSCEDYDTNYVSIGDLTKMCDQGDLCVDSRTACEVLEEETQAILDNSFIVSEDAPIKAYDLQVYYEEDQEFIRDVMNLEKGNMTKAKTIKGFENPIPYSEGNIIIRLEVYYS